MPRARVSSPHSTWVSIPASWAAWVTCWAIISGVSLLAGRLTRSRAKQTPAVTAALSARTRAPSTASVPVRYRVKGRSFFSFHILGW